MNYSEFKMSKSAGGCGGNKGGTGRRSANNRGTTTASTPDLDSLKADVRKINGSIVNGIKNEWNYAIMPALKNGYKYWTETAPKKGVKGVAQDVVDGVKQLGNIW